MQLGSIPLGCGCNRSHILHPWPNGGQEKMIFAVFYVSLNNVLDSDKTSNFFVLIFAVFLPSFSFSSTTSHGLTPASSKVCMCSISTPHKTRMFTVRLAGNGHGFAVAVLALAMPLDHPNVAATVLRISLNSGAQKAILHIFKKNYHWSSDCHWIPNL